MIWWRVCLDQAHHFFCSGPVVSCTFHLLAFRSLIDLPRCFLPLDFPFNPPREAIVSSSLALSTGTVPNKKKKELRGNEFPRWGDPSCPVWRMQASLSHRIVKDVRLFFRRQETVLRICFVSTTYHPPRSSWHQKYDLPPTGRVLHLLISFRL